MISVLVTAGCPATMGVLDSHGETIKKLDNGLVWHGTVPETGEYTIVIWSNSVSIDFILEVSLAWPPH
jgi:hypothetical protein